MVTVQVLKRKDAASVVVAIVVALIIQLPIISIASRWASSLSGLSNGPSVPIVTPQNGWQGEYLYPLLEAAIGLLLLEILIQFYVWASVSLKKK